MSQCYHFADPPMSALRQLASRYPFALPVLVLVATAAAYAPALSYDFVLDDGEQIVQSQPRYTWSAVPSYFTTDIWSYTLFVKTNYYRPGFLLWLLLNSKLFGLNTALWHAAAIGLHLAATFLLFFLARRLTESDAAAGAAALLFGLHPAHVEAVAWVSGATESLFGVLVFSTLLLYLRGQRLAAWLMFAAAMFSKETSAVVPVLLAACEYMFPESPGATRKQRLRAAAAALGIGACIVLLYAGARIHALGTFAPLLRAWTPRMLLGTIPSVLAFYLHQLLVPLDYSLFYPIAPIATFGWSQTIKPLLELAAAAAVLLWLARQSREFAFSVLLLVLPILPVLNLRAFAFDDFQHDRYLYVPSAGLCLLLALAGARFLRREAIAAGLVAICAGGLAYVTIQYRGYWSNGLTLYSHAIEAAPDSMLAAEYMAGELLTRQQFADALPLYQKIVLKDARVSIYENISNCYLGLQEFDRAIAFLEQAISVFPHDPAPHYYLAQVYMRQAKWKDAEAEAREAIRMQPYASPILAVYHGRLGDICNRKAIYHTRWPSTKPRRSRTRRYRMLNRPSRI